MSNCSGLFNLIVWSKDCRKLLIQDLSDWFEAPDIIEIEVTAPNVGNPRKIIVKPGIINSYTNEDLGYSGQDRLFDGIYCFTTMFCGRRTQIYRAIVCSLECCYRNLIASGKEVPEETLELLRIWIEDIPIITEAGRLKEAKTLFEMVHRELKNLNCNC